jgi:hypothetical protein
MERLRGHRRCRALCSRGGPGDYVPYRRTTDIPHCLVHSGLKLEKLSRTAKARRFYHRSWGNFAENGVWHVLKEASVSGTLVRGSIANFS